MERHSKTMVRYYGTICADRFRSNREKHVRIDSPGRRLGLLPIEPALHHFVFDKELMRIELSVVKLGRINGNRAQSQLPTRKWLSFSIANSL